MQKFKFVLTGFESPIIEAESEEDAIERLFGDTETVRNHIRLEVMQCNAPADDDRPRIYTFHYRYRDADYRRVHYDSVTIPSQRLSTAYDTALAEIGSKHLLDTGIYSITDETGKEYPVH